MSIKLKPSSIIYINCPAQVVTGGPEALHQLYYKMRLNGLNAMMYYTPEYTEDPVAERYKQYDVKYATTIEDHEDNIIVVPEVRSNVIEKFTRIKKAIWWLSIDNYFKSLPIVYKLINKPLDILYGTDAVPKMIGFPYNANDNLYHFAQSEYAKQFLEAKKLKNIYMLSDYLNLNLTATQDTKERQNRILYNPKKGIKNTKRLIKLAPELNWTPLENMSISELKEVLNTSKIYIDFGSHPGKDRLPREAAISGCCIITGKDGSARNNKDVAIPETYKFADVKRERESIIALIKTCFSDFEKTTLYFEPYRSKIKNEEQVFEEEIRAIFKIDVSETINLR